MSFLSSDTKGDILRNYSSIAKDNYGYKIAIIDLRNPTKSDGFNLLHLVNKYTDLFKKTASLAYKAKAEKYVSIFKLIQELLAPSKAKGKTLFHILMDALPPEHKARWFAGAALSSSEQAMASVMSTALARLNAFLDSELEQLLCFGTAVDAETFCKE